MNDIPEKRIASSPIRQSPGSLAKLNDALAAAQAVYPVIPKKHRADVVKNGVKLYSYLYADLADVMGAIRPILGANGLSVQHFPYMRGAAMVIICRMSHSSGAWIECEYPVATLSGDGFNHQTLAGGVTFAKRYSYCAVTGAVAEETIDDAVEEDGNDSKWQEEREPDRKPVASPPRRTTPKANAVAAGARPEGAEREKPAGEVHPLIVEMLRMTTPESLKQWHADASDRIMKEGAEWGDSVFYPRYDDHMQTLKGRAAT